MNETWSSGAGNRARKNALMKFVQDQAALTDTDFRGAARDLLTDFMHVCDDLGLNFGAILDGATEVYEIEAAGEES
jgi:hypothetical protein